MTKKPPYHISEIKLTYTRKVKADERPQVTCSEDAHQLFRANWDDMTINLFEEFKILLLDRNNRCMGIALISKGGVSGTYVDAKLVFAAALKARATGIILGHNHPSGGLKTSHNDLALTDKLISAGLCLDLPVLDHLILTDEAYVSMVDMDVLPFPKP